MRNTKSNPLRRSGILGSKDDFTWIVWGISGQSMFSSGWNAARSKGVIRRKDYKLRYYLGYKLHRILRG